MTCEYSSVCRHLQGHDNLLYPCDFTYKRCPIRRESRKLQILRDIREKEAMEEISTGDVGLLRILSPLNVRQGVIDASLGGSNPPRLVDTQDFKVIKNEKIFDNIGMGG